MRSPAPKPAPEVPAPSPVEPIPGVELLNVNNYKNEPTITVWIADKGYVDRMMLEKYLEGVLLGKWNQIGR